MPLASGEIDPCAQSPRLSFLLYELGLILIPYTYRSFEGYFGGIIKVSRALCDTSQCPTMHVVFLFQSHSCQCEMLDRKVLVSPVIKILYLHGEITATQSQMKILRKEIRKIIFHCICHSFFAKIIWHLYNIWLIIKAKPLSEAGVKMVIFTQNMRTRSGFWTRAHPVMFYLSN